jgi:hypothetical protein
MFFNAKWLLCVPSLTFKNSIDCPHCAFVFRMGQGTDTNDFHYSINQLLLITETQN